jgi:hypothetical protein
MKKYIHQMAAIAILFCHQLSSKASFSLPNRSISFNHLAHDSDSEGFFSPESTLLEFKQNLGLSFHPQRANPFGTTLSPFNQTPISLMNSKFPRRSFYRYRETSDEIKIGISIITPTIEYKYCTSAERAFRGGSNQLKKFWIAQIGYHLLPLNNKFSIGIKRGYTIDHFEAGFGLFYSNWPWIKDSFSTAVLPSFNLGFTTLGLNNRFRFNCGIGLPEIFYIGTSYSL